MPKERAASQRGGKRPGAGRPRLGKEIVKAYLPRDLVRQLAKLAKTRRLTKSKIIEDALRDRIRQTESEQSQKASPPAPTLA